MIETEAIDKVRETNEPGPPRRVDHPHRPVADHPQPRITGVERVPRHRSEIDQLVDGIARGVGGGQRRYVGDQELAAVETVLQIRNPGKIVAKVPRTPRTDVEDPLPSRQPLHDERLGHRGQFAAAVERPEHMIADRTARRSEHHPRLTPRRAYSSHDVLLKVAVPVIFTSPPTPLARRAAHRRAILAHRRNKGNPTGATPSPIFFAYGIFSSPTTTRSARAVSGHVTADVCDDI